MTRKCSSTRSRASSLRSKRHGSRRAASRGPGRDVVRWLVGRSVGSWLVGGGFEGWRAEGLRVRYPYGCLRCCPGLRGPDASGPLVVALAAKAGVPTSTVSRIEDEQSDPTLSMLERLVEAAGGRLAIEIDVGDHRPTIAALATAVDPDAARLRIDWTRLRGFADWAVHHPDELVEAIADPPARTGTPLDAILAAFAEQLADERGIERPRWTRAVGPLREDWSPPATSRMRAAAEASTPEPFRRRNVVLSRSALFRSAA